MMDEQKPTQDRGEALPGESPEPEGRFPELERLQEEIERQIRGNRQFLERFLDEDFVDEEEDGDGEAEEFEEL